MAFDAWCAQSQAGFRFYACSFLALSVLSLEPSDKASNGEVPPLMQNHTVRCKFSPKIGTSAVLCEGVLH